MTGKKFKELCENCPRVNNLQMKLNILISGVVVVGLPFFAWVAVTLIDIGKNVESNNVHITKVIPDIEMRVHEMERREISNAQIIENTYKKIESMINNLQVGGIK
jgi:hypothetical protein